MPAPLRLTRLRTAAVVVLLGAVVTAGAPTIRVQRGDTLSEIAERELANANRWREIFELNRDVIEDPDEIFPGQVLVLPTAVC